MELGIPGRVPIETLVRQALERVAQGEPPSRIEVERVDFKEERGRRAHHGGVLSGETTNDPAAEHLAEELACMANTPGGGAVIVGVSDDGARIGTRLDADWLRHRIWELTSKQLTVAVREASLEGCRILILTSVEALAPIRYRGKLRWRVGANCVEVDPVVWQSRMLERIGFDWSGQPSGQTLDDVSPTAIEVARDYLREAKDPESDTSLAHATDADLLRRLNLTKGSNELTNAGALLFVATPWPAVDYIRRDMPGGDSTLRIEGAGPLLVQVRQVEQAAHVANRVTHTAAGFAHGRVRAIPPRTLREAVVNGLVHRDWLATGATVIEHVGDTLTVTSPGGFVGGVTPENIITHPAVPRYRNLSEAMASLGLAEREGIGVDRMVRDMLAMGRPAPVISEVDGPYVRVALLGGPPDTAVLDLVAGLSPGWADNVDSLLLIEHLTRNGWVDAQSATGLIQRSSAEEANDAIRRLADAYVDAAGSAPVISPVRGVPTNQPVAYRLSDTVGARLAHRLDSLRTQEGREALALDWCRARGRVSSTEVADLTGLSKVSASKLLTRLADAGQIQGGRARRRGRGFFYVPL
ncbi:MAG: hypothetical protein F4127_09460 [Gammaproteobacteria bacterium]|nr:hypothetical protein [Gammaproteobacteria bacterium]